MENEPYRSIVWPPLPGTGRSPAWTGQGFLVNGLKVPVLSYEIGKSGWDESLAEIHVTEVVADKPIVRASHEHTLSQLAQWLPNGDASTVLEIGCSSGNLLEAIRRTMPTVHVVGADYVRTTLEALAERIPEIPLIQLDLAQSPLPSGIFDGIVALNVLEHIEDDNEALRQIIRMLKPGGIAVIEVPAGAKLFDFYDKSVGHWRRYGLRELEERLIAAGFEIVSRSHLGFFVYPIFWLGKQKGRLLLNAPESEQREAVIRTMRIGRSSKLLRIAFSFEAVLRRFVFLPTGIRCLVTCRRPHS